MPALVRKMNHKYFLVDHNGARVTNQAGTPVDKGGHSTREEAEAQARAINANMHKEGKI